MPDLTQLPRYWSPKGTLVALSVLAVVVLMTQRFQLGPVLTRLPSLVTEQGFAGMITFAAAYTLATLIFVPAAVLTLLAGSLFGLGWGVAIVAIATSVADALSFLIARYLARGAVARLTHRYSRFFAVDQAITQAGWRVVALLRLSPTIPYSASNYLYGLTGIPFLPYLLASAVFTLPGTFVYVYLGYIGAETLGGHARSHAEWTLLGFGLAMTLVATTYVTVLARRALVVIQSR